MTNLKSKKRMAASVLGVGTNKIRFNDVDGDKIEDAITRGSIRALVKDGTIYAAPKKGISKSRHLKKIRNLKKRGRTTGSKKGAKYSRITKKRLWIIKIRAIRRRLKIKKDRNEISNKTYWDVYKMAGSGQLRNVKHMEEVVNSKQ